MIIQTDADNTMYSGNLLVSLGWRYIRFLLSEKKYFLAIDKAAKMSIFYFLSHIPSYIYTAFFPFKGCPVELMGEVKNPIRKKWLETIEKLTPQKIIIISRQEKNILQAFISGKPELEKYNFEIVSNIAEIENGKFTGKIETKISYYRKQGYINDGLIYIGDLRDYLMWGRKNKKFILI